MEGSCPNRALDTFPDEQAKIIVKSIIDTLINADFSKMLSSDVDIEFALDPLLYSFKLPEVEGSLSIFSRWLVNPNDPSAILNHERYNKYIRQIFGSIPLIYETRRNHTPKALDETFNFLKNTICPPIDKSNNWKHPFEPQTWVSSLQCIINSIYKTDARIDYEIRDKLLSLFIDGILISDLQIEEADQLIHSFLDICFVTNNNGQLLSYDKYWYKLFSGIFTRFLNFPSDERKCNFILNLIKKMKACSKEYEDKCLTNTTQASINWPIREKFFQHALKNVKDIQNQKAIDLIFKPKFPGEAILQLFGDCMFVSPFWDYHILDNINQLFSFFSYGEFSPYTKWQEIFMKYLCFLMEKKMWNSLFKVVYGIMNFACYFIAEYPSLFNKILNIFLSRASSLDLPYFTQAQTSNASSNSASINYNNLIMKADVIPNINLLGTGSWVSTMASLLEYSRVEENKLLEDRVLAIIEKFCNCSQLPFIVDDYNVYRLVLLANAEKGDLFANLIAQDAPTAQSLRVERIWDFELLALAISPYFMPDFVVKIIEKQVIEHILANFKNNEFSDRHIFWLLITLMELSRSTNLFVRNRQIVTPLIAYLSDQKRQRRATAAINESSAKNINYCINKMIDIVYYSILIPIISGDDAKEFNSKYKKINTYAINDRIFSFGENDNSNSFGVIVRGPFGISSFEITETANPEKQPQPEHTLKENILHRDEIQFPSESIFPVYKENVSVTGVVPKQRKCLPKSFLMAMGFSSIESTTSFHSIKTLDSKSSDVLEALEEFDKLCGLVSLDVKVGKIQTESFKNASNSLYQIFLDDLGQSYKFGSSTINFVDNDNLNDNDVVIIFNDSGLRISNKLVSKLEKDTNYCQDENVKLLLNNLVIEVAPIYNSISEPLLLYQVKILRSKWKCLILPFPIKKPFVSSRSHLPRTLAMICFFYFSRFWKDEILTKVVEDECPKLVSKYIEEFDKRSEKLEILLKLQKKEDTIDTILID